MAAFSSGCSHPTRLPSATLAENVSTLSLSSSSCLKIVKSLHRSPSVSLLFPTVHLSLPLHVSFSLFTPFTLVLAPIYPPLLLTCLTAEENEQRKREERDKGGIKNECGVRTGSAFLLPCHANGFQIRLHITPRR